MNLLRLNKYLAEKGIASRRKADELIAAGKVKVNGKVAKELGVKVDTTKDKVEVADEVLVAQQELVYLMLNKPAGFVTSSEKTKLEPNIVMDLVPNTPRIFTVGRLDKATTGLLILTNDGVLAYRLTHPKFECEKEYEVELETPLTGERIRKIEAGVKLEKTATKPTRVIPLKEKKARIIITEGKNRQVRKIFGKVGCEVLQLQRVRVKQLTLGNLAIGKWRKLTPSEVKMLRDA
jgi:pseudouridine synthase